MGMDQESCQKDNQMGEKGCQEGEKGCQEDCQVSQNIETLYNALANVSSLSYVPRLVIVRLRSSDTCLEATVSQC